MKYTEEEKKSLKFLTDKRDEAYGLMQFEDGEIYQLAEKEFNNYLTIEEIIDKQQKEIEKCKVAFNAQVEALIKMTNVYNNLYNKIREKIIDHICLNLTTGKKKNIQMRIIITCAWKF